MSDRARAFAHSVQDETRLRRLAMRECPAAALTVEHLMSLLARFGLCTDHNRVLARKTGQAVSTVRDHLRALRNARLILIELTTHEDGSQSRTIRLNPKAVEYARRCDPGALLARGWQAEPSDDAPTDDRDRVTEPRGGGDGYPTGGGDGNPSRKDASTSKTLPRRLSPSSAASLAGKPEIEPARRSERFESKVADAADPAAYTLWTAGVQLLAGMMDRQPATVRSLIGKWLKLTGDDAAAVFGLLCDAKRRGVADPAAWISRACRAQDDKVARSGGRWI